MKAIFLLFLVLNSFARDKFINRCGILVNGYEDLPVKYTELRSKFLEEFNNDSLSDKTLQAASNLLSYHGIDHKIHYDYIEIIIPTASDNLSRNEKFLLGLHEKLNTNLRYYPGRYPSFTETNVENYINVSKKFVVSFNRADYSMLHEIKHAKNKIKFHGLNYTYRGYIYNYSSAVFYRNNLSLEELTTWPQDLRVIAGDLLFILKSDHPAKAEIYKALRKEISGSYLVMADISTSVLNVVEELLPDIKARNSKRVTKFSYSPRRDAVRFDLKVNESASFEVYLTDEPLYSMMKKFAETKQFDLIVGSQVAFQMLEKRLNKLKQVSESSILQLKMIMEKITVFPKMMDYSFVLEDEIKHASELVDEVNKLINIIKTNEI